MDGKLPPSTIQVVGEVYFVLRGYLSNSGAFVTRYLCHGITSPNNYCISLKRNLSEPFKHNKPFFTKILHTRKERTRETSTRVWHGGQREWIGEELATFQFIIPVDSCSIGWVWGTLSLYNYFVVWIIEASSGAVFECSCK